MMQVMQSLQTETNTTRRTISKSLIIRGGLAIFSIGLALIGSFGLATWAEVSATHHAIQHIVLFLGGVGVGSSFISLTRRSK